jgi:hypothetical protein
MKILLDENLPIKLKSYFEANHEVFTTFEMNWNGKQNGDLLRLLVTHHFDAFITGDKNLKHQQKIDNYKIAIILLNAPNNRLTTLIPYMKKVNQLVKIKGKIGLNEIKI